MSEQPHDSIDVAPAEPDWDSVFERIDIINFPDDVYARANDVARNLTTGKDVEMFGKAIHGVVAPDVSSMPASYTLKVGDSEKMAEPAERPAIYERAAQFIRELNIMRQSEDENGEFLRRVANIVALSIVGAHAYENGNGRTARVMAELIRNGSSNKDDLVTLATERVISKERLNGFLINSYLPTWKSKEQGKSIHDIIGLAASVDIPLSQKQTYLERTQDMFTTPYGD